MTTTKHSLTIRLAAVGLCLGAVAFAGCADPIEDSSEEQVGSVQSAATLSSTSTSTMTTSTTTKYPTVTYTWPTVTHTAPNPEKDDRKCLTPTYCPASEWWPVAPGTCGYSKQVTDLQQKVTATWKYLLGASTNPTLIYACNGGGSLSDHLFEVLRKKLAEEASGASSMCKIGGATPATVCGVKASVFDLKCRNLTKEEVEAIGSLPAKLDSCWGTGASGFFNAEGGTLWHDLSTDLYDYNLRSDPEPARLTANLSGSTGSTAAAYYLNTGAGTTAITYPGSWSTYGSSTTPAGMPCSTTGLGAWSDVTRVIQASGSYRRCI